MGLKRKAKVTALSTCVACGHKHADSLHAVVCCLFAPDPTGWCAECGKDCNPKRTFCSVQCGNEFRDEALIDMGPAFDLGQAARATSANVRS